MSLTATQERIVEAAMDATFKDSDQEAADYAIDQLINGGTPEYYEGGARPDRDSRDAAMLIDSLKRRLSHVGIIVRDDLAPTAPRTWDEE